MAFACILLAWSAGSARAAGALDGVAAATSAAAVQAPAAVVTATQQATTSLRRSNEPVRRVARPAVAPAREAARPAVAPARVAARPAVAPAAAAPVPTVPRPDPAPVLKAGVDAVSTAPVVNTDADASAQTGGAATSDTAGERRQATPGHARATAASLAAQSVVARGKHRAAHGFGGLSAARTTTGLQQSVIASAKTPSFTAAGWRNRAAAADAHRPQGEPGTAPVSGPGGATSVAAASSAAASAAGLLGLLLFLTFAAQRLGALIRLQPDCAPPAPFLALPERPG